MSETKIPQINLPDGMTDAERQTAADAAAASAGDTPSVAQLAADVPKSTVTKASQRTAPSRWNIEARPYGIRASHDTGEVYHGDIAGFNAHLKG